MFLFLFACAECWGNSHSDHAPGTNCFFVCYSLGSHGHKHHWLPELFGRGRGGTVLLVRFLKVGLLNVGSNLFMEKLGVGGSLLIIWCCGRGDVYKKGVPQSFLYVFMWAFSHLPDE